MHVLKRFCIGFCLGVTCGYALIELTRFHHWYTDKFFRAGYVRGVAHGANYMEQKGDRPSSSWLTSAWRTMNTNRDWPVDSVRVREYDPKDEVSIPRMAWESLGTWTVWTNGAVRSWTFRDSSAEPGYNYGVVVSSNSVPTVK